MTPPAVVLAHVSKVYHGGDGVRALDGVTLTIEEGEWVAVTGPSGSGKTTLLNLLDGLDRPTEGRVEILGRELSTLSPDERATFRRENVGLVFQEFHLVGYLTALENVMLAQYYHSMVDRGSALAALESVEMAGRATHLPSQLSGGEKQRVSIARALVNDPKILLADEPTGNLDEANEKKVLEIFGRLKGRGKTLVVVTHNPDVAALADRTIHLAHGRVV
ncbi:MAG: ABC transporter ATP-binding protein [Planctomycetes bacterium]|nr:ABC transporter ATP-binding protein [Planctomycetota bacterium]